MSYFGSSSEGYTMGGDLELLLSPKRKRSSRSTSSKKNYASHQPNSTQSLDNITSPLSSPVGSSANSFSRDSNGLKTDDFSVEIRCSVSSNDDSQHLYSRSTSNNSHQNMSKFTSSGSTTPPSSSSSGYNGRSLLNMVYQSAGKGRVVENHQIISPSPGSSPDSCIGLNGVLGIRRCDFTESAAEYGTESGRHDRQTPRRNSQPTMRHDSSPLRACQSSVKLSTKENYDTSTTAASFFKRFTYPGSENLRPQEDSWFSNCDGESDDEEKSSMNSFFSRHTKSRIPKESASHGSSSNGSDEERQLFGSENEGNDVEGRFTALNMGRNSFMSRSIFCDCPGDAFQDTGSKVPGREDFQMGLRLKRGIDVTDESASFLDALSSDPPGPGSVPPDMDTESPEDGRDFIRRSKSPRRVNHVTEQFIGRVGASMVVKGTPFSASYVYASTPTSHSRLSRTLDQACSIPLQEMTPLWDLPEKECKDDTETVRFPYSSSSSSVMHTPMKTAAEDMGDLGTPVTEVGSPAVIDMDAYVESEEVDGGFSHRSLFDQVKEMSTGKSVPIKGTPSRDRDRDQLFLRQQPKRIWSGISGQRSNLLAADQAPPCEEDSNISHITVESSAMFADDKHGHRQPYGYDRHEVIESVRTRDQLDELFHSTFGDSNASFSSSFSSEGGSGRAYLPLGSRSSQSYRAHGPRPLPDQSAFDRGSSRDLTSPTPATPARPTPMRTPRPWVGDRGPDSNENMSEKSSMISQQNHVKTSSLTRNEVFVSLSDSISTPDVSFQRDFKEEGHLGTGTFADVYMARERNGKLYAVKKSKNPFKSHKDRTALMREVNIMEKLGETPCDHIVSLIRAWQENGYLFVQIDLAERGTLRDLLTASAKSGMTVSESTVWHILHDLAAGLRHIHDCGIVHLDVKPANLLISLEGRIKIGDFGMAVHAGKAEDGHEGDSGYMAPELLNFNPNWYPPADIFSLGLTLYELCIIPHHRERMASGLSALPSEGSTWQLLRHGQAPPLSSDYSTVLCGVIASAMEPEPENRPTTQHLLSLAQVIDAASTSDHTLLSASNQVTGTGVGSGLGMGIGCGGSRINRSASFNPSTVPPEYRTGTAMVIGMGTRPVYPINTHSEYNWKEQVPGQICLGGVGGGVSSGTPTGVCDAYGTVRSWHRTEDNRTQSMEECPEECAKEYSSGGSLRSSREFSFCMSSGNGTGGTSTELLEEEDNSDLYRSHCPFFSL